MKYFELDRDEEQLLETVEKGEFKSVQDLKQATQSLIKAAKVTGSKSRNIRAINSSK